MNLKTTSLLASILSIAAVLPTSAQEVQTQATPAETPADGVREIIFNTDDDQNKMTSKVYQLKHVLAADITGFVANAVARFDGKGKVARLNYKEKKEQYLVVTTSAKNMPWIDQMITTLDRPGKPTEYKSELAGFPKPEDTPSIIDGTGISRFTYRPKFRGADAMRAAIRDGGARSSDGEIYFDADRNFFYYKDSQSDGETVTKFLTALDRPVPQLELTVNVYEVSDGDLKELGVDWVSWKNGPALNLPLFGTGLSGMSSSVDEQIPAAWMGQSLGNSTMGSAVGLNELAGSADWMYGGIFFAPQFDASFLRLLAQKNKIRTASSAAMTLINGKNAHISFSPDFQNIQKTTKDIVTVESSAAKQGCSLSINSPVIGFNDNGKNASLAENIIFDYVINTNTVTGRDNLGAEAIASTTISSKITLMAGCEKPLAVFSRETDVKQENHMPFLGEIPYLKHLFGYTTESKTLYRYFVTISAKPVSPDRNLSEWAGQIIEAAKTIEKPNVK